MYQREPSTERRKYFRECYSELLIPSGFKYIKNSFIKIIPHELLISVWMQQYGGMDQPKITCIPFAIFPDFVLIAGGLRDIDIWHTGWRIDHAHMTDLWENRKTIQWTKTIFEQHIYPYIKNVTELEQILEYEIKIVDRFMPKLTAFFGILYIYIYLQKYEEAAKLLQENEKYMAERFRQGGWPREMMRMLTQNPHTDAMQQVKENIEFWDQYCQTKYPSYFRGKKK